MVFASFAFLFWFLPLFLGVYFALPARARNLWLTAASFSFYGWWRPDFLWLLPLSTTIDWWCARRIAAAGPDRRRRWLLVSLVTNLGLLGWFKYANLAAATLQALAVPDLQWQAVILPVGISFYTFQSLSYTIDVYRGKVEPVRSLLDLLCYVSMFPQLVAGPIVRFSDVRERLFRRHVDLVGFSNGVFLVCFGVAKKVLIADQVAPLADAAFGLEAPGLVAAWTGVLAFALQIYFDFSGYSDIAIGLGRMLGFEFPENFHSPYRAHSITEFWRRWHISLSTWLRDYLYVPLGGNRGTELRTYANLLVTMLLGGLWHGAAWTFVLWGGYQGVLLALERRLGKTAPYGFLPRPLQIACTFVLVLGGWVIFKADSVGELWAMWSGMVGAHGAGAPVHAAISDQFAYGALVLGAVIAFAAPRADELVARFRPLVMAGGFAAFLLAVCHLLATDYSPFLYWRF